jgi:NMT1/THI5 like
LPAEPQIDDEIDCVSLGDPDRPAKKGWTMTANGPASPGSDKELTFCTPLRIRLDWHLNPDHLPLIALRASAIGLGAELILEEPTVHGEGFEALARGECDLIVSEPLHLLEPMARAAEALGCFLETKGGVLVRADCLDRLRGGETLHVASPVSGRLTDGLCRRMLQRWAGRHGFAIAETQIAVGRAGLSHVESLEAGFDAAWLAFANVEAVAIQHRGLAVRLLTPEEVGLPGFSALELVARKTRSANEIARHEAFVAALERESLHLQADPGAAVALWQAACGCRDEETATMVAATLPCLKVPIDRAPARWASLEALLAEA